MTVSCWDACYCFDWYNGSYFLFFHTRNVAYYCDILRKLQVILRFNNFNEIKRLRTAFFKRSYRTQKKKNEEEEKKRGHIVPQRFSLDLFFSDFFLFAHQKELFGGKRWMRLYVISSRHNTHFKMLHKTSPNPLEKKKF